MLTWLVQQWWTVRGRESGGALYLIRREAVSGCGDGVFSFTDNNIDNAFVKVGRANTP
jgi:hypothetical protein